MSYIALELNLTWIEVLICLGSWILLEVRVLYPRTWIWFLRNLYVLQILLLERFSLLADLNLLYRKSVVAANLVFRCEKKRFSLVWFFDICGLQFGMAREVCCHLVLVLWFGDLLFLGVLQLLDLICVSLWVQHAVRGIHLGWVDQGGETRRSSPSFMV